MPRIIDPTDPAETEHYFLVLDYGSGPTGDEIIFEEQGAARRYAEAYCKGLRSYFIANPRWQVVARYVRDIAAGPGKRRWFKAPI